VSDTCRNPQTPGAVDLLRNADCREWAHLFSCYITAYSILKNTTAVQQIFPAKTTHTIVKTISFPLQAPNEAIHEKCNSVYLNIFETSQKINSTRQLLKETDVVVFILSILVF